MGSSRLLPFTATEELESKPLQQPVGFKIFFHHSTLNHVTFLEKSQFILHAIPDSAEASVVHLHEDSLTPAVHHNSHPRG